MKSYTKVILNNKAYTLEELGALLGFEVKDAELSMEVEGREFTASVLWNGGYMPALAVTMNSKDDGIRLRELCRVEQEESEHPGTKNDPRVYLYGASESYIAYSDIDTRPDEEAYEDPYDTIVVGGCGPDQTLLVELKNPYTTVVER